MRVFIETLLGKPRELCLEALKNGMDLWKLRIVENLEVELSFYYL